MKQPDDDMCPVCQIAGSGPVVLRGSCDATCSACGADWCSEDDEDEDPRTKGDDDGQEYGDPRDYRDGKE